MNCLYERYLLINLGVSYNKLLELFSVINNRELSFKLKDGVFILNIHESSVILRYFSPTSTRMEFKFKLIGDDFEYVDVPEYVVDNNGTESVSRIIMENIKIFQIIQMMDN